MDTAATARSVLDACGGVPNVASNAVCMTRLRLVLEDPERVDTGTIETLHGVLGVRRRGEKGVEVVFGPALVDAISREFSRLTQLPLERKTAKAITQLTADGARPVDHLHSTKRYGGPSDPAPRPAQSDLDELRQLLESAPLSTSTPDVPHDDDLRVLVLNGPNLNLLGIREPDIYGADTYADLVDLCQETGRALGLAVQCFQTNHEGVMVDKIQEALESYDGLVLNPAAYTHTSVALLDAIKAVGVPTVEVHISDVSARENFRQVSYVRAACIATITGEGFEGYAHALRLLKEYLEAEQA